MIADIHDGKLKRVPTIHSKVAEWQCDPELGHRFNISQLIIRDKSLLFSSSFIPFRTPQSDENLSFQSVADGRGRTRRRRDFLPSLLFHLPRRKRSSSATPSLHADPKNAMDLSGAKSGSAATTITTAKRVVYRSAISNPSLLAENKTILSCYDTKTEMYAEDCMLT